MQAYTVHSTQVPRALFLRDYLIFNFIVNLEGPIENHHCELGSLFKYWNIIIIFAQKTEVPRYHCTHTSKPFPITEQTHVPSYHTT